MADFRANTEARPFDPTGQSKLPLWNIVMEVAVRDYGILQTLEDGVRNEFHTIQSSGLSKTEEAVRYPWLTREVIRIIPGNAGQSKSDSSDTEPNPQPEATSTETTVSTEDPAPSDDVSESIEAEGTENTDTEEAESEAIDIEPAEDDDADTSSNENETT